MDSDIIIKENNALVIAYYFPPMGLSGVQRTLKFVKYLTHFGWNPIVLTSNSNDYYAYDNYLTAELESLNITVLKAGKEVKENFKPKKFPSYFTQKIGRAVLQSIYLPDSKIGWKKYAVEKAKFLFEKYKINVIFSTAPPYTDFLVAKELSEMYSVPFVIDYRDVWVDNSFNFYPTPFHKSYHIKLEKDVLTCASKIIVTTRHSKETILKRYRFLSHNDVVIIPHGYDIEDFEDKHFVPDRNRFVITHSGLFQDNRTPKYFLKALSNFLKKNSEAKNKITAKFVGLMRKGHLKYIKKYGLTENVEILGFKNHSETIDELITSDVLWLMMFDVDRSPGKLYEYIGAKKPILISSPDGNMRQTALDTKAAIATEPKDVAEIEAAIAKLYSQWQSGNLPKPDKNYASLFDRKKLTHELSRELSLAAIY